MSELKDTSELKKVLGVPVRWELNNFFKNYWNPNDSRIMPEKYFGIGWDINFYALSKKLGLLKSSITGKDKSLKKKVPKKEETPKEVKEKVS